MELTVAEICWATNGTLCAGAPDTIIKSVTTDSRAVESHALFVPLRGSHADGHSFIPAAFAAGALGTLVQRGVRLAAEVSAGGAVIEVDDPLRALADIARCWRERCATTVVAITGSNGKTSTKEMAWAIVARRHRCFRTPGNFNNLIGVPLSLCMLQPEHETAILELGMSERGELSSLCAMSKPSIGLITNIGPSHLEQLKTLETVAAAKAELFESLPQNGSAIVNRDDPFADWLAARTQARVLTFGIHGGEVTVAGDCQSNGFGTSFVLQVRGKTAAVRLRMPGMHFLSNALAAAAIADALGMDLEDIVAGLEAFTGVQGRMETVCVGGLRIINDAYNANPASMQHALKVLASMADAHRRIAVLGDMLELGEQSSAFHYRLGQEVAALSLDYLLVTGQFADATCKGARSGGMPTDRIVCRADADALGRVLVNLVRAGDAILVKGSRRMRMERVIALLQSSITAATAVPQTG